MARRVSGLEGTVNSTDLSNNLVFNLPRYFAQLITTFLRKILTLHLVKYVFHVVVLGGLGLSDAHRSGCSLLTVGVSLLEAFRLAIGHTPPHTHSISPYELTVHCQCKHAMCLVHLCTNTQLIRQSSSSHSIITC